MDVEIGFLSKCFRVSVLIDLSLRLYYHWKILSVTLYLMYYAVLVFSERLKIENMKERGGSREICTKSQSIGVD